MRKIKQKGVCDKEVWVLVLMLFTLLSFPLASASVIRGFEAISYSGDFLMNTTSSLNIFAGGSSRLFINGTNGYVGIGTASPIVPLEYELASGGPAAGTFTNMIQAGSVDDRRAIALGLYNPVGDTGGEGAITAVVQSTGAAGATLHINPKGANIIMGAETGNVGIGTTNPTSALTIEGTTGEKFIEFQDTGTFGSRGIYWDDTCTDISAYDGSVCIKWGVRTLTYM